jgi:ferredoxin-NADP reductase/ferredoxin
MSTLSPANPRDSAVTPLATAVTPLATGVRARILPGCNGMGSCARLAPNVFRIDPATGKAYVTMADCSPYREAVLQAARSCPFVAVEIDGVSVQEHIDPAVVLSCDRLTPDIVELRLRRQGFAFIPGQYVFLRLADLEGEFFRTYSVVNSADGVVTLCIRLVPNGRAGRVLAAIRAGTDVGLSRGKGLFTLLTTDQPKLFVTGGTGLAPVVPMCEAAPEARKLVLVGARTEADLFWIDRLLAIPNTEVMAVVQNPGPQWQGPVGKVTDPLQSLDIEQWSEVYTCGSPGMVQAVRNLLTARGMAPERIFADSFVPAGTAPTPAPGAGAAAKPRTDWPGLLRRGHAFASTPLALIFLFYAVTGFIANRSDWFAAKDTTAAQRTLPAGVALDRASLEPVLTAMLPDGLRLESWGDGQSPSAVFAGSASRSWLCTVNPANRSVRIVERGIIPSEVPMTASAVGGWLGSTLSGNPDLAHATDEDGEIEMELSSVWGNRLVKVDSAARTWTSTSIPAHWSTALIDLHRGKQAAAWQRPLIDVTALVLALVTLSGSAMSLIAASAQRRRLGAILLAASAVLLILLLISR